MKKPIGDAEYWRRRAAEARKIAEGINEEDPARKTMLRAADDCENLARRADQIERQQKEK